MQIDSTENNNCNSHIKVPYDIAYLTIVLDWATSIARLAGATNTEQQKIRLALDETLTFFIKSYAEAESWELLHIHIYADALNIVKISIANAGPPVHLSQLPEYDPTAPAESDHDGLWYFLAQQMVDKLQFKNLGRKGWVVEIEQQIEGFDTEKVTSVQSDHEVKKLNLTTRMATAADSPDLIDLTFDTYRYSYPGEDFYHHSQLQQAFENNEIISILVEANDTIAGSFTILVPPETPHCAYVGTLMVHPKYRTSRAIAYLIRESNLYMGENPLSVDLFYATMVTKHTASQKAGHKSMMFPTSLMLGVGASVDYRGMDLDNKIRESFVTCVRTTKTPDISALYLPEEHHKAMQPLLEQISCTAQLVNEHQTRCTSDTTELSINEDPVEGTAYITINSLGKHWQNDLQKKIFSLRANDIKAIVFLFPAWSPYPENIEQGMSQLNSIFTGIKPLSAKEYYSVYCCLSQPIDFDQIKLADPLAEQLKEHVQGIYKKTFCD